MLSTAGLVPVAQEFAKASWSGFAGSEWNPVSAECPSAMTPTGWVASGGATEVVIGAGVDEDGPAARSVTVSTAAREGIGRGHRRNDGWGASLLVEVERCHWGLPRFGVPCSSTVDLRVLRARWD